MKDEELKGYLDLLKDEITSIKGDLSDIKTYQTEHKVRSETYVTEQQNINSRLKTLPCTDNTNQIGNTHTHVKIQWGILVAILVMLIGIAGYIIRKGI
jgi:hypothetical protein